MANLKDAFDDFIAERNKALRDLDIEWAKRMNLVNLIGRTPDDETLVIAMHKARYELNAMEPRLRHESRLWLEQHGLKRHHGLPWPEDRQVLPA